MDLEVGRVLVKKDDPAASLPILNNEALQIFTNLAKSSPGSSYLSDNFANVYSELGMAYADLGSDVRLRRNVRRKHWLQARAWYRKSLEVWVELQRQGKVLSEYSGEPKRITQEIKDCTRALGHLP